jgi:hypothetical protein
MLVSIASSANSSLTLVNSMSDTTLSEAVTQYGNDAYLLTVGNTGPHASNVSIELRGNTIDCAVGPSAAKNIASDPRVSLLWPPIEPGGYAMILNGTATGTLQPNGVTRAKIKLTKSLLHRPGLKPADGDGPCASDCKRIVRPE